MHRLTDQQQRASHLVADETGDYLTRGQCKTRGRKLRVCPASAFHPLADRERGRQSLSGTGKVQQRTVAFEVAHVAAMRHAFLDDDLHERLDRLKRGVNLEPLN